MRAAPRSDTPAEPPAWDRWTRYRVGTALGWLVTSAIVGVWLLFVAGLTADPFFGVSPSDGELRFAAAVALLAGLILAAAPLKIWWLRRRAVWLIRGIAFLALGAYLAGTHVIEWLTPEPRDEVPLGGPQVPER